MVFQDKEGSTPILPTPLPTNPHILGVHTVEVHLGTQHPRKDMTNTVLYMKNH